MEQKKKIWITSDLHLGHNKPFLYEPRGFKNIQEHDETIIKNWNSIIKYNDDIVCDLTTKKGPHKDDYVKCVSKLKNIYII